MTLKSPDSSDSRTSWDTECIGEFHFGSIGEGDGANKLR